MKYKGSVLFSLAVAAILILGAFYPNSNNPDKEAVLMQTLIRGLDQLHYDPDEIDDDFSKKVFKLYLDRLDGTKRFFLQSDIDDLKKYQDKIDDEAKASTFEFFNASIDIFQKRVTEADAIFNEILDQPFDFSKEEVIEVDNDKKVYATTKEELKDYWRKYLKYSTLSRLNDKLEEQEKSEDKDAVKKTFKELEAESREKVRENNARWLKGVNEMRRTDRLSLYLNAFTNVFDPHTSYYEPKDKANFDISMSGTLEGIGARLQTDDDYTKVINIIPGGPAWKQKDLKNNDLIMKVAQGDEEPVDVTGFRIDDVVKLIRGKKGTIVKLTVKSVDGSIKVVSIKRDVVIMDESYAKSAILNYNEGAQKIGYIKLPRFYADFNKKGGRSCAADIAKELEKLKDVSVNGIILDLRNNGGGSLRDVVTMSGLFIEEGPIVQVKARDSAPDLLLDEDPSVQYDGPLIVMVNSFSASASEILAAALQDYGRAVIIGSNSTFGKGTVQRFYDLDRAVRDSNLKPLGEIKMTIQKFYRVNGGSTQLKGVTPDILLPDNYNLIPTGEQENEFAMEWTEIESVPYSQNVYKIKDINSLKSASNTRIKSNPVFQKIEKNAQRLKDQRDKSDYPLSYDKFDNFSDQLEADSKQYEDMFEPIDALSIVNLRVDMPGIQSDTSKVARNDAWLENLQKDVYLEEALYIMDDMIKE